MTTSNLTANKALAIQLIGEHCVNAAIGEEYEKKLPHFKPILDTTWKALADDGYVRLNSSWHFQVTPVGWIKGLEATGKFCDEQMQKGLGTVSKALKDCLERTEGPALVGTDEVVSKTFLSYFWVVNVIHSHLIRHCLKRIDADWAQGDRMESVIEVPVDFGHRL